MTVEIKVGKKESNVHYEKITSVRISKKGKSRSLHGIEFTDLWYPDLSP